MQSVEFVSKKWKKDINFFFQCQIYNKEIEVLLEIKILINRNQCVNLYKLFNNIIKVLESIKIYNNKIFKNNLLINEF